MDFLDPILGGAAGLNAEEWKAVLLFSVKGVFFCLPFVALGAVLERDIHRVTVLGRVVKTLVVLLAVLPGLGLAILNLLAPRLPASFWETRPWLENLWIMEGTFPPVVFLFLCSGFLLLYLGETWRGSLRD
jgi:hypothetical protein